ncbi:MAG: hypothetical protein ACRENA_16490 [Vulcanimicrobiaceae bacterium]
MSESSFTTEVTVPIVHEEGKIGNKGDDPKPSKGDGEPTQDEPGREHETGNEGAGT